MTRNVNSHSELNEQTERINRVFPIYLEEYRAAAEAAGRKPEELALCPSFDVLQVAGATFTRDSLGVFHPLLLLPQNRPTGSIVAQANLKSAVLNGCGLQFSPELLEIADEKKLREALRQVAEENLAAELAGRSNPRAIDGYEYLQPYLERFYKDHPDYERNVFVMMRFRNDAHYLRLYKAVEEMLKRHDLQAVRADQKSYPDDDDLWANIVVYMLGCRYGVAIFEDFDERMFNANVALEYGFMRALNKRVLILKEQRMPQVPTDVTANRFKEFDMMRIDETVPEQIEGWLHDLEIS